jgi:hypothetical protein
VRVLWRLFAVPFGLLLAVSASSACLIVASVVDPVMSSFARGTLWVGLWSVLEAALAAEDPAPLIEALGSAGRLLGIVILAPPVLVALASELIGARRLVWHVGATGLLTGALPWLASRGVRPASPEEMRIAAILALAGAVAGFVYWLVAGHGAGADPVPPHAPARPPR